MMIYKPKNILITGGCGFIGSHFTELLSDRYPDYNLVVYDKFDYCATQKNLESCVRRIQIIKGDICDFDRVTNTIKENDIDTIVHFAAQSHVDSSFGNSLSFTHNNTYGTHVLLEASRKTNIIKRFIYVSTDEVYGETSVDKMEGLTEDGSVLKPTNPYSAAKAGAEMMCYAYINSYKFPIIITRGNNVYGPRQHVEKLIPKIITYIQDKKNLPIHGEGTAIRSFLYVKDVANAFDIILHHGEINEIYNIGTDRERDVMSVVEDICDKMEYSKSHIQHVEDRLFNDRRYFIGVDKLHKLGWKENTPWAQGLEETIKWFDENDWRTYWTK